MGCKTNQNAMQMKKLILICTALAGGTALFIPSVSATQVHSAISASVYELPDDARSITVYKIVQVSGSAWSTSPKDAYYSRSENCIYVTEGRQKNQPYSITENRAYGQSNDGRAEYRYTAGGYFFNL